ncbi:MAG: hypothetical protein ACFFBD_03740 [Candidatus Hodarchaeota archaeon]
MDITVERNPKFKIRPGKLLTTHRNEIREFEGLYTASKAYPAVWCVDNQNYVSCALEKELEVPGGTVVKVKGQFKTITRKLPSGKEYQARVLEATSVESLVEPLEKKFLDEFRSSSVDLMRKETGIQTVETEESEASIVQKVMWDANNHQWLIGYFMQPPLKKMGSALFHLVDREGKPLKIIVSELKKPVLE